MTERNGVDLCKATPWLNRRAEMNLPAEQPFSLEYSSVLTMPPGLTTRRCGGAGGCT